MLETRLLRSLYEGPRRLKKGSFKELQRQVQFKIPDGYSVAAAPRANDVARTEYHRFYGAVNQLSSPPVDPTSYAAVLLQNSVSVAREETRMQYPGGLYGTPGYQPAAQSPVVRAAYVPPVLHGDVTAAAYQAQSVYEAEEARAGEEEEGGRDPLIGARDPDAAGQCCGLIWVVVVVTVVVIGVKWLVA